MSGSNHACDSFNTNGPQATYVTFQNHFIPELIQSFLLLNIHLEPYNWYQTQFPFRTLQLVSKTSDPTMGNKCM